MKNESKDAETWPGEERGEMRDGGLEGKEKKKAENNATQAGRLNDSAAGSRHGVSAKLYMKHANCNIPAFLLPSITIETRTRQTVDPYS